MRKLHIKNVGPIKEIEFEPKRFNFFIGPQSCGKSTIAKVFSACSWIEKEVATTFDENVFSDAKKFLSLFIAYHKMETYFDGNPEIHYETDVISIDFENNEPHIVLKDKQAYHRQKICYIPSERNVVTLPELQGYEFGSTDLRAFLFDWFKARESFNYENKADVLNLGVKYYYDPEEQRYKDRIEHINGKTYRMPLGSASSGLQSVIPLHLMMKYYSDQYFHTFDDITSFDMGEKTRRIRSSVIDEFVLKVAFPDYDPNNRQYFINEANRQLHEGDLNQLQLYDHFQEIFKQLTVPVKTSFIIEEPEQNLFPDTQTDLLESLISACNGARKHELMVTTHSPYILNQLNLLFRRFDVKDENAVGVDFDEVAAYAITDGQLVDLKLKNAHLINPEYLSYPLDRIYHQYEAYDNFEGSVRR